MNLKVKVKNTFCNTAFWVLSLLGSEMKIGYHVFNSHIILFSLITKLSYTFKEIKTEIIIGEFLN